MSVDEVFVRTECCPAAHKILKIFKQLKMTCRDLVSAGELGIIQCNRRIVVNRCKTLLI
jgi:hypothetical protein